MPPVLGTANIINLEDHEVGQIQFAPQYRGQLDNLRIDIGPRHAKCFYAELMKLAITTFLWALVPEHGTLVPEPLLLVVQQAMLICRPHTAGGAFGSQGQAVAVTVIETVHLLFDDIGDFPDRALEQLGLLEDRKSNLSVTKALNHAGKAGFEILPGR